MDNILKTANVTKPVMQRLSNIKDEMRGSLKRELQFTVVEEEINDMDDSQKLNCSIKDLSHTTLPLDVEFSEVAKDICDNAEEHLKTDSSVIEQSPATVIEEEKNSVRRGLGRINSIRGLLKQESKSNVTDDSAVMTSTSKLFRKNSMREIKELFADCKIERRRSDTSRRETSETLGIKNVLNKRRSLVQFVQQAGRRLSVELADDSDNESVDLNAERKTREMDGSLNHSLKFYYQMDGYNLHASQELEIFDGLPDALKGDGNFEFVDGLIQFKE